MRTPGRSGLLVERGIAAAELGACLRKTIVLFITPAAPLGQCHQAVEYLEQSDASHHLGRIEQVSRQHGNNALLQLQGIAWAGEEPAHHRIVEAVDEEGEALHARALPPL